MKYLFNVLVIINVFITNALLVIGEEIHHFDARDRPIKYVMNILDFYMSLFFVIPLVISLIIITILYFIKFNNTNIFAKFFILDIICYIQLILFISPIGINSISLNYLIPLILIIGLSSFICFLLYRQILIRYSQLLNPEGR